MSRSSDPSSSAKQNEEAEELLISQLTSIPIPLATNEFRSFSFNARLISIDDTVLACQTMFDDMTLILAYKLNRSTLIRFIRTVKNRYRSVPYHSWSHAFVVGHFAYVCMKNIEIENFLKPIDCLSLLAACFCHDIDHRGQSNLLEARKREFGEVYAAGSVLEKHHVSQTMQILAEDKFNIFKTEKLSTEESEFIRGRIIKLIMQTDVSKSTKLINAAIPLVKKYEFGMANHRYILSSLIIAAADLSDQTKPWIVSKSIAIRIYEEFFAEGDVDRNDGRIPIEMMDRTKACIPKLQVGFIDNVVKPIYESLARILPAMRKPYISVLHNRDCWDELGKLAHEFNPDHSNCKIAMLCNGTLEGLALKAIGPVNFNKDIGF